MTRPIFTIDGGGHRIQPLIPAIAAGAQVCEATLDASTGSLSLAFTRGECEHNKQCTVHLFTDGTYRVETRD